MAYLNISHDKQLLLLLAGIPLRASNIFSRSPCRVTHEVSLENGTRQRKTLKLFMQQNPCRNEKIKLFIYWDHMLHVCCVLQSYFLKNMLLPCFLHFFLLNSSFWPDFLKDSNFFLLKKFVWQKKGKLETIFKWSVGSILRNVFFIICPFLILFFAI